MIGSKAINSPLVFTHDTGIPPFTNTKSLLFDGLDDNVDIGTGLNLGTVSTVSMWIKRDRTATSEILLGEDSYTSDYVINIGSNNWLYYRIGGAVNNWNQTDVPTIMSGTTNWIHICFIRNGNSVSLYLNGAFKQTLSVAGGATNTRFDTIGSRPNFSLPFAGNIDEVAAWNVDTVVPADVYNGGVPTDLSLLPTPPVSWWRMGDLVTAFPAIPDVIGTNNGIARNENEATMVVPNVP